MQTCHIKKGDEVVVIAGSNKGKRGKVIEVSRSKSRAMLSVAIHKKGENGQTSAVTGAVTASAVNLNGQLKTMTLREIKEAEAIYYIGELAITDGEVLIYTIDVTPSNDPSRFTVRFKKQFFVENK